MKKVQCEISTDNKSQAGPGKAMVNPTGAIGANHAATHNVSHVCRERHILEDIETNAENAFIASAVKAIKELAQLGCSCW
jgi:hypothetical protein